MRCPSHLIRVSALLVGVLIACGGATSEVVGAADSGTGSDSGTTSGSSGSSVVPPTDASLDARPDGPNTRLVSCGAKDCLRDGDGRSREVCCVTPGAPPQMACTRELDPAACDQGRRECDDTADCSGGEVCCAETSNDDKMSTRCMPSCITGVERWQVCKTSAECAGGIPCTMGICPRQGAIGFCVGAALPRGCR
jgi:hypothetical protein